MYTDTFSARFETVGDVVARAQAHLLSLGIHEQVVSLCILALSEATNNVVEHSYAEKPDGQAELRIQIQAEKMLFTLTDWGAPPPENLFYGTASMPDPDSLPEGGWGLALIDAVMDGVAYKCVDGANQLELVKHIG